MSDTFKDKELEILRLSDEAEEIPIKKGRPGRPLTRVHKYYAENEPRNKGGRPRKTDGDYKTQKRREQWRNYHLRKITRKE